MAAGYGILQAAMLTGGRLVAAEPMKRELLCDPLSDLLRPESSLLAAASVTVNVAIDLAIVFCNCRIILVAWQVR